MKLTYIKAEGEPNGDAGDQYTGLDRFGRVVDQRWPQGSNELERVDYGFTAASNRQWRQNRVAANGQDEYYNYDGLYQVAELNRGTLNGGKTGIAGTPSWTEDFTYDPIGNWDNYLTKVAGTTSLDQERTHNTANETTEIDDSSATVAHDLAGNMVKVPQVADWEATLDLKWDAWNRLVEVVDGETVVAEYRYDGKTRRVLKTTDAVRHYYYSDQWQILEERLDDESTAERQFIWGQRYLDDLVLRDRDVDADGSLDERLYVLSDYFNPTAIADEDGVVVERYGYNAFGLSRVMDADFEPRSTSDYDWETRYGAYRYDAETGFYQVRFRYLHPTLGRWISRDPIEEAGGFNLFVLALNNTLNRIDAFGLDSFEQKATRLDTISQLREDARRLGGGLTAGSFTTRRIVDVQPAEISSNGEGAACECSVEAPRKVKVVSQMNIATEKSYTTGRDRVKTFVDNETIRQITRHEETHLAINRHFSSIFDQFETWQTTLVNQKGADCKIVLQQRIQKCLDKAITLYEESVVNVHNGHSAETLVMAEVMKPRNWLPGSSPLADEMVSVSMWRMQGAWNPDLSKTPVPSLNCDKL